VCLFSSRFVTSFFYLLNIIKVNNNTYLKFFLNAESPSSKGSTSLGPLSWISSSSLSDTSPNAPINGNIISLTRKHKHKTLSRGGFNDYLHFPPFHSHTKCHSHSTSGSGFRTPHLRPAGCGNELQNRYEISTIVPANSIPTPNPLQNRAPEV